MIKSFLLAVALATSSVAPVFKDYPKNLPNANYEVKSDELTLKYWISLDPNCVVQTVYTVEGPLVSEITFLDPDHTLTLEVVNFIIKIENHEGAMQICGSNEDGTEMYTSTENGHFLKWERDPSTKRIRKVTIVYHKPSLES